MRLLVYEVFGDLYDGDWDKLFKFRVRFASRTVDKPWVLYVEYPEGRRRKVRRRFEDTLDGLGRSWRYVGRETREG